ncbi:hypothetical protein [Petroclostridium sp. X23]|uniref:hypothetical protein n=1 Tax=Petroclostridium sp. X23 TaxID=3045146 RepID=UPI0024AE5478|nr:hypothetical protein [Petroclostridium sp. X23]WHH58821.1 hypothetical protein QKW49_24015 [Petroclostridium sp. X23]
MMKVLVCIDDTDNLDSMGTGELAALISKEIQLKGWGKCRGITRHQLLVHPDIPYTSHNSAMCFEADIDELCLEALISCACEMLKTNSAEGSDPGLCVVVPHLLPAPERLVAFGKKAKEMVLTKAEAYAFASEMNIHLSEHGGTGQGVIGALAGTGLRLGGNDGRYKGKLRLESDNNIILVKDIYAQSDVEVVKTLDGTILDDNEAVILGEHLKAVLLNGKSTLLVIPSEDASGKALWKTCSKQLLRAY